MFILLGSFLEVVVGVNTLKRHELNAEYIIHPNNYSSYNRKETSYC